ncbi:MAG: DUF3857 domain-containing transglutaminase family protein [Verrucomicrobiales bacterium]|nr:DUF3857 domain-containing transglutaminase family protein [Verrucomicrobiales bacterium]
MFHLFGFSRHVGILIVYAILLLGNSYSRGQETDRVNTTIPEIYLKQLAPLITPIEDVLPLAERSKGDDTGATLLDELVRFVGDDGKYYRVIHKVYKANTEAGVEILEKDSVYFRKGEENVTLIEARTIQPDGKEHPIRKNAMMIQDIRKTGDSLYENGAELLLVYPNVEPGSVTEVIALIERESFRIPNEMMFRVGWKGNVWPKCLEKIILSVPGEMADRITITELGHGAPQAAITKGAEGRTLYAWEEGFCRRQKYESSQPTASQKGPSTFVTTWKSWDDLAVWYRGLLEGRNEPDAELAAKAKEWTKGLESEEDIIGALFAKVANDVRYVGLEFGLAGLQPYQCNEVWENGYGDCKDKSNLLCSLLGLYGIEAWITLVDTDHNGLLSKKSPNYLPFTHAIVAVRDPSDKDAWLFLDPTISRAESGTLGPWVANRDVAILKDGKAIWARTPDTSAGTIDYHFEVELESSGGISGWLEFKTDGYYASSYAEAYSNVGEQTALNKATDLLQSFFDRAEVIDLERDELKDRHSEYRMKAYFVAPYPFPNGLDPGAVGTFSLPPTNRMMPHLGDDRDRAAELFVWPDTISLRMDTTLPEPWSVLGKPASLRLSSEVFDVKGEWKTGKTSGQSTGTLEVITKKNTILPSEFPAAFNIANTVSSWLKKRVQFTSGDSEEKLTEARESDGMEVANLPVMPSGRGQLRLIESRYPSGTDSKIRKAALENVIRLFSEEHEAVFEAKVKIGYLSYNNDEWERAAKLFKEALKSFGNKVELGSKSWGEYSLALALIETETPEDGFDTLERLAADTALSEYRRLWSGVRFAAKQNSDDPDRTLKVIRPLLKMVDDNASPALYDILAGILVEKGQSDELQKELQEVVDKDHPFAVEIFEMLADSAAENIYESAADSGGGKDQVPLYAILEKIDLSHLSEGSASLREKIDSLSQNLIAKKAYGDLTRQLLAGIEKNPPELLDPEMAVELPDSPDEAEDLLRELDAEKDAGKYASTAVEYFREFPARPDFSYFFWRLMVYFEWHERLDVSEEKNDEESFFLFLSDLGKQIPGSDENYFECLFTTAIWMNHRERYSDEAEIFRGMLEREDFNEDFNVSAYMRLGTALEKLGKFPEAIEAWMSAESDLANVSQAVDAVTSAGLLSLEIGELDRGIEIFQKIQGLETDMIESSEYFGFLEQVLRLIEDPETAKAYWEHTASWWGRWNEICEKVAGGKTDFDRPMMGFIDDLAAYQEDVAQGVQNKDGERFLQSYWRAAHLGRWIPGLAVELGRLTLYGATPILLQEADANRDFVIQLNEGIPWEIMGEHLSEGRLFYAIALADNNKGAEANELIQNHFTENPEANSNEDRALARVWAHTAITTGKMREEVKLRLEKLLAGENSDEMRNLVVTSLANVLRQMGDLQGEKSLLEAELEHPVIRRDATVTRTMRDRLGNLMSESEASAEFTAAVGKWLAENDFSWLPFSSPADLDAPELYGDYENMIDRGVPSFDRFQNLKFWILVSENESLTLTQRWNAFSSAVVEYAYMQEKREEILQVFEKAMDLDGIPENFRGYFAVRASLQAMDMRDVEKVKTYLKHPVSKKGLAGDDWRVTALRDSSTLDFSSPETQLATGLALIKKGPLDSFKISFLKNLYADFLEIGSDKSAESLRLVLGKATLAQSVNQTATSLKLELLKMKKDFERDRARNEKLHSILSKVVDPSLAADAEVARNYQVTNLSDDTDPQVTLSLWIYAFDQGRYHTWSGLDWLEFCEVLGHDQETMEAKFAVAELCIDEAADDTMRSYVLGRLGQVFDTDDEKLRARLMKMVRPWKLKTKEFPCTASIAKYTDLHLARRAGEAFEENEFLDLTSPNLSGRVNREILRIALQSGDKVKIEKAVGRLDADDLVAPSLISTLFPALSMIGQEAELELVREEAILTRNRELIESWATGDTYNAMVCVEHSMALEDLSVLTDEWFEAVMKKQRHPRYKIGFHMDYVEAQEDWEKLVTLGREAVRDYPTFYDFQRQLGLALFNLGRKEEARKPIKEFVDNCYNELEHSFMQSLYNQLDEVQTGD